MAKKTRPQFEISLGVGQYARAMLSVFAFSYSFLFFMGAIGVIGVLAFYISEVASILPFGVHLIFAILALPTVILIVCSWGVRATIGSDRKKFIWFAVIALIWQIYSATTTFFVEWADVGVSVACIACILWRWNNGFTKGRPTRKRP